MAKSQHWPYHLIKLITRNMKEIFHRRNIIAKSVDRKNLVTNY